MNKLDKIFIRIIRDEQFADTLGSEASRVDDISAGKRAVNKYIRAIAETLELLNKNIEEKKVNMRLSRKTGDVIIPEAEYQAIYRKILSSLNK